MTGSSAPSVETDVLIIGGGLAGLALADHLYRAGRDYMLIEARERFGGRILSHVNANADFDLGPAWFWPGQARMAQLADRLDVDVFEQYSLGDLMAEDQQGNTRRGAGWASMEGSLRIQGGMGQLIDRLCDLLPPDQILTGHRATQLKQTRTGISVLVEHRDGSRWVRAHKGVLALPPRIAATSLAFQPDLTQSNRNAMLQTATWMAGHAKIVAIYDRAHWREAGLSGDAMSQYGPMAEIHDASPQSGGPYALFGFLGIPAPARLGREADLKKAAISQLVRLFGSEMATPREIILQDWAQDPLTAISLDHNSPRSHPAYGPSAGLSDIWQGNLILGSTELGSQFGGFLEGALEVAETTAHTLSQD